MFSALQRLRLSSSDAIVIPPTPLCTVGDRAFPVSAARVWNALPAHVTVIIHLQTEFEDSPRLKSFPPPHHNKPNYCHRCPALHVVNVLYVLWPICQFGLMPH